MTFICMTDWYVWSSILMFISILGVPVTFAVSFSYRVYITRKYLDEMMMEIKSSPDLSSTMKVYASLGFFKKMLIPGLLHGAVSEPRFLSIGFISNGDVKSFPRHFRRILSRDSIFQKVSIFWFLIVVLLSYLYLG